MYRIAPAIIALNGMVISHAIAISFATCHLIILILVAAPAPTIEEEMTCVVDIGNPNTEDMYIIADETVCETNPCMGFIL